MPLDQGAAAPRSPWALRLERLKIIRRKANTEKRKRRRITEARLHDTERLLGKIITGADFLAEANTPELWEGRSIFLLLSLSPDDFNRLCEHGAEFEDLEDSHDREPDNEGQPSLMPTTGADLLGFDGTDNERDDCDLGEPRVYPAAQDQTIITAARARYKPSLEAERQSAIAYAAVDPEKRAGLWVLQRKRKAGAR